MADLVVEILSPSDDREQAREKGQIARSRDLVAMGILSAGSIRYRSVLL